MRGGHHEIARAYVLYRERRAQERPKQGEQDAPIAGLHAARAGPRRARRARPRRAQGPDRIRLRRPGRQHHGRPDRGRDDAQPVRRRAARRGLQGLDPGRPHADREGPRLHLRHRPPAAAHDLQGGHRPRSDAGRTRPGLRRLLPAVHQEGRRQRAARREAAAVRPEPPGRRAQARARPAVRLPRPADPVRPLLPARAQDPHRAAAGLLHARGDGPGAQRDRPRSPRHRVLRGAVVLRLHVEHADPVQQRHAALAAVELLPDHRARRPRRHLRVDQGKRAAVQVRRRPGQRLDPRARAGQPHQGHQRRVAGRRALPQGGERHRRGGQPGRQAQGRGLHLPGKLAPRHRGVPRAAQEHRRRPPPHARHEHGQLDPRPVHAPRDGKGQLDAVLALQRARPARQVRRRLRDRLRRLRREGRARRDQAEPHRPGHRPLAQDAHDAVRDRPSLDHLQGRLQRALAPAARRRGSFLEPVHRDHAQHQRHRNRGLQPRARSTCCST